MDERMVRNMIKLMRNMTPQQMEMASKLMETMEFALDPIARVTSFFTRGTTTVTTPSVTSATNDKKVEVASAAAVPMALHVSSSVSNDVPVRIMLPSRSSAPVELSPVEVVLRVRKYGDERDVQEPSTGNRKML